jgi:hypothetical protein
MLETCNQNNRPGHINATNPVGGERLYSLGQSQKDAELNL